MDQLVFQGACSLRRRHSEEQIKRGDEFFLRPGSDVLADSVRHDQQTIPRAGKINLAFPPMTSQISVAHRHRFIGVSGLRLHKFVDIFPMTGQNHSIAQLRKPALALSIQNGQLARATAFLGHRRSGPVCTYSIPQSIAGKARTASSHQNRCAHAIPGRRKPSPANTFQRTPHRRSPDSANRL